MAAPPLDFPCDYPVKVMGRQTPEFRARMHEVFARHSGYAAGSVSERPSRDGTFLALTCTLRVADRGTLEALYQELHATGLVLFAL
jgi:putative lipoic acid-binding regulatory protein